jgi:crotonobetaine/carnitine-CoA ligase
MENRPEFIIHWLALNALGVSVVPVNPDYIKDDLAYLISHSEPDLIVGLPARVAHLRAIVEESGGCPVVNSEGLDDLPTARRPKLRSEPGLNTEGAILYTSGTTGLPKACRLCNSYFLSAGERYLAAGGLLRFDPGRERLYNVLPLFYVNSFGTSNMAMIMSGGCMIIPDRFHPASFWAEIAATRATIIHYLGLIPPVLLAMPATDGDRAHNVKFGVGAGIDPSQHEAFEKRFGFPLVEVWGISEVAIASAENHEPRRMEGRSIGKPLTTIEFEIRDEDDRPLPDGEPGELVLRRTGPDPRAGFFSGYFKDEAETENCWRGGWYHTGDVVKREPDGRFTFVDRKKHMIRRSGQNIAAAEVEQVLLQHPMVSQVGVVPAADPLREEEVFACVVLKPGHNRERAVAESLVSYCLERIAYFKAPGWISFADSLPRTSTEKLRKSNILPPDRDPSSVPGSFDLRHMKTRR